jgi:hypothetical protein
MRCSGRARHSRRRRQWLHYRAEYLPASAREALAMLDKLVKIYKGKE